MRLDYSLVLSSPYCQLEPFSTARLSRFDRVHATCSRTPPGPMDQSTPAKRKSGAQVRKGGEKWAPILVRERRRSPEKVWQAPTDPAHLREWAAFEGDGGAWPVGTTRRRSTIMSSRLYISH